MKNTSARAKQQQIAPAFWEFLYKVPAGGTFNLWNLQGALRFDNPGVPTKQKYVEPLQIAIEERWLEPVTNQPDTYRRIGHKRSAYTRHELQLLKIRSSQS
jgi:hypothetical protein